MNDTKPDHPFPKDEFSREDLVYDQPAETPLHSYDHIPSGYDPIGRIYLEGRTQRSLAGGRVSWWVLITSWIVFGMFSVPFLILAIALGDPFLLCIFVFSCVLLIPVWRGTRRKLAHKKKRTKIK